MGFWGDIWGGVKKGIGWGWDQIAGDDETVTVEGDLGDGTTGSVTVRTVEQPSFDLQRAGPWLIAGVLAFVLLAK